jgi:DNA topoisomerase-1
MQSTDRALNQLGVCTYLIDKLALRVGNEKGDDEADTVGCCSLRVEHVKMGDENDITFDFLGKDSMRYFNTVEVTPVVRQHL